MIQLVIQVLQIVLQVLKHIVEVLCSQTDGGNTGRDKKRIQRHIQRQSSSHVALMVWNILEVYKKIRYGVMRHQRWGDHSQGMISKGLLQGLTA